MPKRGSATEQQTQRGAFLASELVATSRARAIAMGHLAVERRGHVTVGKPGSPSDSRSGSGRCTVACLELSGAPAPPSSAFPVIVGQSLHSQTTQLQRSEA
jgi:hypothetical protein